MLRYFGKYAKRVSVTEPEESLMSLFIKALKKTSSSHENSGTVECFGGHYNFRLNGPQGKCLKSFKFEPCSLVMRCCIKIKFNYKLFFMRIQLFIRVLNCTIITLFILEWT